MDNNLFEGHVLVWIAGLPTTPNGFATEARAQTTAAVDNDKHVRRDGYHYLTTLSLPCVLQSSLRTVSASLAGH